MSEDYSRRIVETVRHPLLVLDADLRVEQANRAFYETFRVSPGETLDRPLAALGDGQWDMPELQERLGTVVEEDTSFTDLEIDRAFPAIGRRVMLLDGRALAYEGGDPTEILVSIEDVTARRELEAELRRQAEELKRSNEELEQFAYAASHDLQEPLRMVSSYLELLESRYGEELEDEAREFMDYAVDGARRMQALINGLLAYSRVGRKEGAFGPVDLEAVWDGVRADLSGRIEETGAEVEAGPLPTVYGNRDQLRRVLQNLVDNALTYGGEGDGPPRVEITGQERADGTTRIAVADRGPGIPAGMEDKVFQLFHQLDPHGQGREGAGMGLALCRKIVERHGGEIGVDSSPGEGATFHFTLALEPGEDE